MASRKTFLSLALAAIVSAPSWAQSSPVPTDIPYAVLVDHAQITSPGGFNWSADGGVYLNDQARKLESDTIQALEDQNATLNKMYSDQSKELVKERETSGGLPVWAQITLSLVGTGASVAAIAFAVKK